MKKVTLKLNVDEEKYTATCQFMKEKGLDLEQELAESVEKYYKKHVPVSVQKYIEGKCSIGTKKPVKSDESPQEPFKKPPETAHYPPLN